MQDPLRRRFAIVGLGLGGELEAPFRIPSSGVVPTESIFFFALSQIMEGFFCAGFPIVFGMGPHMHGTTTFRTARCYVAFRTVRVSGIKPGKAMHVDAAVAVGLVKVDGGS